MGQYYHPISIDRKEFLYSHTFGDGLKLMEFGLSGMGMMAGLAVLLCNGNGRGGGDLDVPGNDPICRKYIGRWAGTRVVIAGDYGDEGKFIPENADVRGIKDNDNLPVTRKDINLYQLSSEKYKDVSYEVLYCLLQDKYVRDEYKKNTLWYEKDANKQLVALVETKTEDQPLLIGQITEEPIKNLLEIRLKAVRKRSPRAILLSESSPARAA
jgi:hypothetical protein